MRKESDSAGRPPEGGALVLETPRLVLRTMSLADDGAVAAMLTHPEVMRYWRRCCTHEEVLAWIERQQARYVRDGHGYWLAIEKATGDAVGQAGVLAVEIEGSREAALGYIIHRPYWGRGFATEAATACRDWAFEKIGCFRVIALIRPENLPSQAVAARIGMAAGPRVQFADFEHIVYSISAGAEGARREADPSP